jgi:hypothetical protein
LISIVYFLCTSLAKKNPANPQFLEFPQPLNAKICIEKGTGGMFYRRAPQIRFAIFKGRKGRPNQTIPSSNSYSRQADARKPSAANWNVP